MRPLIGVFNGVIILIALVVFVSGIITTGLGIYEFVHTFQYLYVDGKFRAGMMAVKLLQVVDMFLVAIVLFIFSLGLYELFISKFMPALEALLPDWMKVKRFIQLKIILWETILTTMVVAYLATLAELGLTKEPLGPKHLIIPGAIFFLAVALFFVKKEEPHGEH